MKCNGIETSTSDFIGIEGAPLITHVDSLLDGTRDGIFITPGFIDLQVNGFAGVDYNSPTAALEDIANSIRIIFSTGVTRFFPTVITGSPEDMLGALRNLARARETLADGPAMEAFHVEGPHISPHDGPRGAHPARWVRPPDFEEFQRWQDAAQGHIRLVTLSPEWPEAPHYIDKLALEGVMPASGHPGDASEQISERGSRRSDAFHPPGQRRRCRPAPPSQLHLGATGRRQARRQFHRGRNSFARFVSTGRAARQGRRAQCAGHRRRDAGDVRAGTVSAGRGRG